MKINKRISSADLNAKLERFWQLSASKIRMIEEQFDATKGAPVFTVEGKYSTRGWTEWTQGFQYGSALLQFDATGETEFLENGRRNTIEKMTPHVSHIGVHDHGFNNVSTYGNLLRLMNENKTEQDDSLKELYRLALKVSGAVQASRWSDCKTGGYIYSFNGPHSLFVDTIRSCRALMLSHKLGHYLPAENDVRISLLDRALKHILATAKYSVFYGDGRDGYDEWGRTAHESVFNPNDGNFRCPNSQQGYSGFTTWTRGLAWAMVGFAEELEFLRDLNDKQWSNRNDKAEIIDTLLRGAKATCDFYIANTPVDGIPYWDTGAPKLHLLGDYLNRQAEPFNDYEPVDSTAAAIGAQGLLRLGNYLIQAGQTEQGEHYRSAALSVVSRLLEEPYLSVDASHQGLLLHSIYHQPNKWDNVPAGQKIACGESSMWGDYHIREVALMLTRENRGESGYNFYEKIY